MARDTFFFRADTLKDLNRDVSSTCSVDRLTEWRRTFPDVEPVIVDGAADLFPATSAETFARWLKLRSAIDPQTEAMEPILQTEVDRFTILPLRDPEMWGFRKKIERLNWMAQEVDLSDDFRDRAKVSPNEFRLITKTLGWFGPADEAVMKGLGEVASVKIQVKEGQFYLRGQEDQECVHSEAYALQIQEVIPPEERSVVFQSTANDPLVARVADWIRWWVVAEHPAADFFAAMAFIEGVLFSGFFATLQYFKVKGVFPGITTLNEFIARDEGIHTLFWCFILTKRMRRRPDSYVVEGIAHETIILSEDFFIDALPEPVVGLNADLLNQYVKYVADTVLIQTGYSEVYRVANPFSFMDMLSLNEVAKSNFFEFRPTQYQNLGATGALEFTINETPIDD